MHKTLHYKHNSTHIKHSLQINPTIETPLPLPFRSASAPALGSASPGTSRPGHQCTHSYEVTKLPDRHSQNPLSLGNTLYIYQQFRQTPKQKSPLLSDSQSLPPAFGLKGLRFCWNEKLRTTPPRYSISGVIPPVQPLFPPLPLPPPQYFFFLFA